MSDSMPFPIPISDFQVLFDAAPHPYIVLTPDLVIQYMNKLYLKFTSKTQSELLGLPLFDLFADMPESWLASLHETANHALRDGCTTLISGWGQAASTSYRFCPVPDDAGTLKYILLSLESPDLAHPDLELLRQLDAERARSEAIIRSIPDAIYVGDEGSIQLCNDLAVKMLGYESPDDLRNNIALLGEQIQTRYLSSGMRIPPEDEAFSHALRGEPFVRDVIVKQVKTGHELIVRSAAAPVILNGEIIGAVAINSDISEREAMRKRLEQLLEQERAARSEAENAIRERDEFLSIAAHELRTPITSLRGFTQVLLRQSAHSKGQMDDQLLKALHTIDLQSVKLNQLLSQLLDVSRVDAGRLMLEPQPTDLVALAHEITSVIRQNTGRTKIAVNGPQSLVATIDPLRLEQVLINLIDNAIKYSSPDSPIGVSLTMPDTNMIQIAVTDEGIGIPPERRPHIFERYYQAHGDGHLGGMGLGLYISRQIVELHGGQIDAEILPEGGTRFMITLPINGPVGYNDKHSTT